MMLCGCVVCVVLVVIVFKVMMVNELLFVFGVFVGCVGMFVV